MAEAEEEFLTLESPSHIVMTKSGPVGTTGHDIRGSSPIQGASSSHSGPPSLFYDEGNSVVISVTQDISHQYLDVVAVSMTTGWRRCLRFARPELMKAIKFSPDLNVVSALWEKSTTFEFVNLPRENHKSDSPSDNARLMPYSYTCVPHATSRSQSGRSDPFEVYGCEWLTSERLVVVTSTDVELLSCVSGKRQVKQLKTQHVAGGIVWYKWAILPGQIVSGTAILALFTKNNQNAAQPLLIRTANIQSLSRFEMDANSGADMNSRSGPRQQDVAMIRVYNCVYLVVLLLQPRAVDSKSYAELQLYQFLPNQNCFVKTRIVRLFPFDSLAIAFSVVDDLLIAHHQTTQTCLVFDLNIPCEYDQFVSYHTSLVPPQPASWLTASRVSDGGISVRVPVLPDLLLRVDGLEAWRLRLKTDVFIKRIIKSADSAFIDEAGLCLITAMGRSDPAARWQVVDALRRVLFDYQRKAVDSTNSSPHSFSRSYLLSSQKSRFDFLSRIMPALASGGAQLQDNELAFIPDVNPLFTFRLSAIPNQSQIANGAFDPALREDRPKAAVKLACAALMELIKAIVSLDRQVEFSLAELLVHYFSSSPNSPGLFQLYQLLQYRTVTDSVPLACSLLALSRQWPAGYQLSLDMLRRLPQGRGISHAAEVLLNSGAPPIEAVRLMNASQQHTASAASWGSPTTGQFVATTPSHASLLATVSSNSPNKSSSFGARSSPTAASSSSLNIAVTGSSLPPSASNVSLSAIDPRKPLDFAVSSESPSQLYAILTYHQQQSHQLANSWLAPYWDKMLTINNLN